MLVVNAIGPGVVRYYLDGRDPGAWSPGAARLLGLAGPVAPADLRAVLRGRDPASGRFLPAVHPAHRRAGWDLVFSAPKSVSLLARGPAGADVEAAHRAAVTAVLARTDDRLTVRRLAATGGRLPAEGLIAARFEHRANAAGEPHAHTHVLVANLSRSAAGWSGVPNDDWFVGRRSLAALYQLALRHELGQRGWDVEWRMRDDGLADVAEVPRSVIRAASWTGPPAGRRAPRDRPWQERAIEGGWEGLAAGGPGPTGGDGAGRALADPGLAKQVTGRLAVRRSDFTVNDVIVALASRLPGGAPVAEAAAWAERFCGSSVPVPSPTAGPRWTTAMARDADDRLERLLAELQAGPAPVTVLGCPPGRSDLMAQAALIRQALDPAGGGGGRAAIVAPTAEAATRWAVLTGLPSHQAAGRPDVLVVDQADRRNTGELLRLAESARARSARLILVEGGTLPRLTNFASHGLARFADRVGRLGAPRPDPAMERAPAAELLSRWAGEDRRALLVGLGVEEVASLNSAARVLTRGAAPPPGAGLGAGDRVVVLRGGDGRPPSGRLGQVAGLDPRGRWVAIDWDGAARTETYGRRAMAGMGPGWAVTPRLAARIGRPVMLLGPASAAPRLRPLLQASVELEPAGRGRYLGVGA